MHERYDEYILTAKLIDDPPGVHGDFANIGVVQFCCAPANVGCGRERSCTPVDLPNHGLGVGRRVFGDVVLSVSEIMFAIVPTARAQPA